MAMTKCKECKSEISTKANQCPKCGAKIPHTSFITKLIAIFIGLTVIIGIIGSFNNSADKQAAAAAEQTRLNSLTVEARAKEQAVAKANADKAAKSEFEADARYKQATIVASSIKASLLDPSSAIWKKILTDDLGQTVCVVVAAKNGFGGLTENTFTAYQGKITKDDNSWNLHCANKSMFDELKVSKNI
jgi:RNA polymerase subunit RPABC4/transcription elongation factor Spt4